MEKVEAIGTEVSRLRKESKLHALENRWRNQREKLSHGSGPSGHATSGNAVVVGLTTGGISVLCGVVALYGRGLDAQLAFASAILIAIVGLIGVNRIMHYVRRYEAAERAYIAKRNAIEERYNKKLTQKTRPKDSAKR